MRDDVIAMALRRLVAEVDGIIGYAENDLRAAIGVTNLNVLKLRRDEARAILAASRAEETPTVGQTGAPLEDIVTIDVSRTPHVYSDVKACRSCLRPVSEPHADNCTWYSGYHARQRCAS